MTEKRFKEIVSTQKIVDNNTGREYDGLIDDELLDIINELAEENEQLKADNNRLVNETAKIIAEHQRKVFELIDKKINLLENDYEKAVKSGMPSNSVYCEIELLEELKKELQE